MITKKEKREMGRKSRSAGGRFELKVRKDLEDSSWTIDKWSNNVDLEEKKLVKSKIKWIYNPKLKIMMPMGLSPGFPDFIAFKLRFNEDVVSGYEVIGVESKMDGILDKKEKEKCQWLLDNNTFSKILIASKGKKRGSIKYKEFKNA